MTSGSSTTAPQAMSFSTRCHDRGVLAKPEVTTSSLQADEVDVDRDGLAGETDLDVVAALAHRAQAGVDAALVARGVGHDVEAALRAMALSRSAARTGVRPSDSAMSRRRWSPGVPEMVTAAPCERSTWALRMPMAPGPTTSAVSPGEATAGSHRHWATQRSGS